MDLDAAAARRVTERRDQQLRVEVPVARDPRRGTDVGAVEHRHELGGLGGADQLQLERGGERHAPRPPQLCDALVAGGDPQSSDPPPARVEPRLGTEPLVQRGRVHDHPGLGDGRAQLADEPGRMPAGPLPQLVLLEHYDVVPAEQRQVIGDAAAGDATADHDHACVRRDHARNLTREQPAETESRRCSGRIGAERVALVALPAARLVTTAVAFGRAPTGGHRPGQPAQLGLALAFRDALRRLLIQLRRLGGRDAALGRAAHDHRPPHGTERDSSSSPGLTSRLGLTATPSTWTRPPLAASDASARVLNNRAVQSHLSTRISLQRGRVAYPSAFRTSTTTVSMVALNLDHAVLGRAADAAALLEPARELRAARRRRPAHPRRSSLPCRDGPRPHAGP